MNSQTERIGAYLALFPNQDVSAIELHRAGAEKEGGFVASLSRRISDLRDAGMSVILSRDVRVGTQRQTFYRLNV